MTANLFSQLQHNNNIAGVIEISDEKDHNIFCDVMQQFPDIRRGILETPSCNVSNDIGIENNKAELIQLTYNGSNTVINNNPKICAEQSGGLMISKKNESSMTIYYDIDGNTYSIDLVTEVLDGLTPQKWMKTNLFDVLLIRMLLCSGREDITVFETVWSKKVILGNYSLDVFEHGVRSKTRNELILFPVLVDRHYIILAYKEKDDKAVIMELDSRYVNVSELCESNKYCFSIP